MVANATPGAQIRLALPPPEIFFACALLDLPAEWAQNEHTRRMIAAMVEQHPNATVHQLRACLDALCGAPVWGTRPLKPAG